ncbi:uncharacterized protein M6B38_330005 [Iris pallida]|uniref:Uncharacterized protein n=1 Tax=Iris pallida TaxID=29817 RepID=A0AAX6H4Y5_IRIPA|nr:Uncharacterized protein M6B38_245385 [Iris pallida]KAJ6809765.1 uncharacterized protein M6B38_163175 [Iris pallida]KAJ6835872.1 uncharacterized protein M6B38_330005 [Iris pallida]
MEKAGNGLSAPALKKGKKKQAKDGLDRLKQAEKKKRRLEKALATSAAIRSELEKKKQKKKEEQQRLDEEGAAIAEAVALYVLVGEDAEDSCHFMVNSNRRYNPWNRSGNIGLFTGFQSLATYSVEGQGWVSHGHGSGCKWNSWDIGQSLPHGVHVRDLQSPIFEQSYQGVEISAGLIAAQAVSSLQIAEKSQENLFSGQGAATVVINRMLGGSNMGKGLDLYKEY